MFYTTNAGSKHANASATLAFRLSEFNSALCTAVIAVGYSATLFQNSFISCSPCGPNGEKNNCMYCCAGSRLTHRSENMAENQPHVKYKPAHYYLFCCYPVY